MRVAVGIFLLAAFFLTTNGRSALSETGTLQTPATMPHDQPVRPPSAAPRVPVQHAGSGKPDKPPAVTPKGQLHPNKPSATAAKPAPSTQLPTPAAPPADTNAAAGPASPEKLVDPETPEGATRKLPRFAALRSDDVNMRAGPGTRYRIEWVYRRRDLPVKIEREFDTWRWVRDPEGIQGWVHQATLMGRRNFVVQKADATLRAEPSDSASAVAVLRMGVIGRIRSCERSSEWCNVQSGSYRGYLRRTQVWGLFPDEAINP